MDQNTNNNDADNNSQNNNKKAKKKRDREKKWKPVDVNFQMPVRDTAATSSGASAGRRNDDLTFTMDDFEAYALSVSEADSYGVPPMWMQMQANPSAFGLADGHQSMDPSMVMANLGINFSDFSMTANAGGHFDMSLPPPMMMPMYQVPHVPSVEQIMSAPLNPDAPEFRPPGASEQPQQQQFNNNNNSASNSQDVRLSNHRNQSSNNNNNNNNNRSRNRRPVKKKVEVNADDFETLRERLAEELEQETYECMICYQSVMRYHWIWSCNNCYHIFHYHKRIEFSCISKWINKSMEENVDGWRCPGCQNVNTSRPTDYQCFCGKQTTPKVKRGECTPHTCGDTCGKARSATCPHPCNLQCHPGPCAECPRTITVHCDCGLESKPVRCGTTESFKCTKVCGKALACQAHKCEVMCHEGPCSDCAHMIEQTCFCGQHKREVRCALGVLPADRYSCGEPCPNKYECGQHNCHRLCHEQACGECPLQPKLISTCPCGKSSLSDLCPTPRQACTDPIQTCKLSCDKPIRCGPPEGRHKCAHECHEGECPPCDRVTYVKCRCGQSDIPVPCKEIPPSGALPVVTCERKCKRTKSCKQHKCQEQCCIDADHICMQICARRLTCGMHTCDRLCHNGRCAPCLQASFDELTCRCGCTVQHPPVPCGTPRPVCHEPCSRDHSCPHPVTHNCHDDDNCPPCTVLVRRYCHGQHELRPNIPCHLQSVSCGRACQAPLSCGRHACTRICHPGDCEKEGEVCRQLCQNLRSRCGHPCAQPCHDPGEQACATKPCSVMVHISCKCGRRQERQTCAEVDRNWEKMVAVINQQVQSQAKQSVQILENNGESLDKYKSLLCDDECARTQRNRQLQRALQIEANDAPIQACYTEYLKSQLKTTPSFILQLERDFSELLNRLNQSRHQKMSMNMASMDREKRRIVHEYAAYFQIETNSYDSEPQRNVVATAVRGTSSVPTPLLSALSTDRRVFALASSQQQSSDSNAVGGSSGATAGFVPLNTIGVGGVQRRLPPQ